MSGYVTFSRAGIKVDLPRFFRSPEGEAALRRIALLDRQMFESYKPIYRWRDDCWQLRTPGNRRSGPARFARWQWFDYGNVL